MMVLSGLEFLKFYKTLQIFSLQESRVGGTWNKSMMTSVSYGKSALALEILVHL